MTTFVDPLGQYKFSLPLGWAYSNLRSHLITVAFVQISRSDERIFVHAVPTYRAAVVDDEWRAEARKAAFRPETKVHDLTLGSKVAIFAHLPAGAKASRAAQAIVIRGRQIDLVVRHENPGEDATKKLTSPLSILLRTLVIPTDLSPPLQFSDQSLVMKRLQEASHLGQSGEWQKSAKAASEARVWARDTFLSSAHGGALLPEVPAVVAVIDALTLEFRATREMGVVRDAERLIDRAAFTLDKLPLIGSARKNEVWKRLQDQKATIDKVQKAVIEMSWPEARLDQSADVTWRPQFLQHNAAIAFEQGDKETALSSTKIAVDDLLSLEAAILEPVKPGSDGPSVAIEGMEFGPEERRAVVARWLEGEVADALRTLSIIHRSLGELDDARMAISVLIDLSQRLSTRRPSPRGHFEPREGQRQILAAAVLDQLSSHILYGTEQTHNVKWQLDQAQLLLEELKEGAAQRSRELFLREAWTKVQGRDLDMRFDQTPWTRGNVVSALPQDCLRALTDWALTPGDWLLPPPPPETNIPSKVLREGPNRIIAWIEKEHPDHEAVAYWQATGREASQQSLQMISSTVNGWLNELNWRRGWAIAALRALDPTLPLAHPGLLAGLDLARARLVQPTTIFMADLKLAADVPADDRSPDEPVKDSLTPPTFENSPFGDRVVRQVLTALDHLVALQEGHASRFEEVLNDVRTSGHPDFERARQCLQQLPAGALFRQSVASGGVGTAVGLILRHALEKAEQKEDLDTVRSLSSPTIRMAARFGCTADFLFAVHRVAAATDRRQPLETVLRVMEHVRLAALWLGDANLEATVQHAIGLILRQGNLRGIPGFVEAIPAFQRAAALYDQLGDTVGAAGALIDLSALLIGYRDQLEAVEEGRDWPTFARRYLDEAMARLVRRIDHASARAYLGEAYQNRARFYLNQDREASAGAALRCIALAKSIGFDSLVERGTATLRLASDDHESRLKTDLPSADEVVELTRKEVDEKLGNIQLFSSRAGFLNAILDTLFDEATRSMEEPQAAALLTRQVEADRGFTYNRWLGAKETVGMRRIAEELIGDPARPVLAVYCVTRSGVGLIVLDGDEPAQLHRIDLTAADAGQLVEEHLAALVKHRRTRGRLQWQEFQERFVSDGTKLVAPLAPYVESGRPICLVPHGVLHGAPLHTLSCSPGTKAIGLLAPVFVNPSIANWLASRRNASLSSGALIATTCPADQFADFDEGGKIVSILSTRVSGEIVAPKPEATDVESIRSHPPFQVLHLSSHGMFDSESMEIGLLMSRNGELPPPPPRHPDAAVRRFLVRPNDIYRQGSSPKLAFLASCVSSRNAEYPGDDLMGLTRAFFGTGTTDMIAGAWTVISEFVGPFTERFYTELVEGCSVADAMLAARRHVGETHPSPFFWGAFQHQGANINPLLVHA